MEARALRETSKFGNATVTTIVTRLQYGWHITTIAQIGICLSVGTAASIHTSHATIHDADHVLDPTTLLPVGSIT